MKVLLANKFFFAKGGAETVFLQERDFLKREGIEVVDFAMRDSRNLPSDTAEYFVAPRDYHDGGAGAIAKAGAALSLIHSAEAVRRFGDLIAATRPDLVHCHNVYHQLTPSILRVAKRMGVPTVLTLHDYKVICPVYTRLRDAKICTECDTGDFFNVVRHRCSEGSLGRSVLLYAEAAVQRLLGSYEGVDRVVVPSRFMGEAVSRWRFPAERVSLVYNGVDPALYAESGETRGYFLYLGRLSAEKGLPTLGAAQAGTGLDVVVAGTGPIEAAVRRDFPGLRLVGHQSGTALRDLISGAEAVVVPSEWHENCPMSVLEAMAAGKPVIGSRVGGIPELVDDGETGLLYPMGDADALRGCMQTLHDHADVRQRMGRAGRARIAGKFSLDRHNQALLDVYRDVLSRKSRTTG